ncbi:MAG: protein kinase [Simkaniaceae bacterium]
MDDQKKMPEYQFPMNLGKYKLLKWVGAGGMGEVFLAEDPNCQRRVALKRLQEHSFDSPHSYNRFLAEAKITAHLSHPSIIPVYSLHIEPRQIFYTMPYIEGETLHEILVKTKYARDNGLEPHMTGSSVYALMLMFLNICQAIHHAHERGYLHRDIKPANIMVRNFTQVVILDWGTATAIGTMEEYEVYFQNKGEFPDKRLTFPESPMGTVDYMATELAFEKMPSIQSDIFSLGATLYFMLTLEEAFDRPKDIREWKEQLSEKGPERVLDPQIVAPEREITPHLSRIVMKCLDAPSRRYRSVQEIIQDIQSYIRGEPEWTVSNHFHIDRAADWEFQENILLAKHMAISRYAGVMEWVMLMLSKEAYSGNIQVSVTVKLSSECRGIGFLLCVPEKSERDSLESGYLFWVGSKRHPGCKFLRSNVEVTSTDHVYLEADREYALTAERQDNSFRFYINGELIIHYISHIPVVGGQFGLLFRDANFHISPITLLIGSQNVQVNCLSVPDAFLMIKDYPKALSEYRRIATSFKGRAEGREATFRAGITLIEMGKTQKKKAKESFTKALEEFEKLHKTAGAPLEYLGKSLVYRAEKNLDEETKCLELAIRMYPRHPLTHVIKEHIMFRLHETAQKDRIGAYTFALLTIRQLPTIYERHEAQVFIQNLRNSWEDLSFIEAPTNFPKEKLEQIYLSIQIAFWLARPTSLYELSLEIPKDYKERFKLLENAFLSLIALGYPRLVDFILNIKFKNESDPEFLLLKNRFEILMSDSPLTDKLDLLLANAPLKYLIPLLKKGLTIKEAPKLIPYLDKGDFRSCIKIWTFLLAGKNGEAHCLLELEDRSNTSHPSHMLQGCYLAATRGEKAALEHFETFIETPFPKTPTLLGHFLQGNIDLKSPWFKEAFFWEKIELYRQLTLYYHCLKKPRKAAEYEKMLEKEFSKSQIPLNFI